MEFRHALHPHGFLATSFLWFLHPLCQCQMLVEKRGSKSCTLQGTDISHLGKRKSIFKMLFLGDMLVPWRVYHCISRKTAQSPEIVECIRTSQVGRLIIVITTIPTLPPIRQTTSGMILGMFPLYTLFPRFSSRE